MSAQYDLYETPDPDCTGEQKPLHARIVPNGTYSKKEFMERVSRSSQTFNYNVIDAVVGVVLDELAETLAEGYIVELGELGHFSISLKCTHKVMTKREIRWNVWTNPNTLLKKWNFLWSNANSFYRNF